MPVYKSILQSEVSSEFSQLYAILQTKSPC
jgi:hypothetical protein